MLFATVLSCTIFLVQSNEDPSLQTKDGKVVFSAAEVEFQFESPMKQILLQKEAELVVANEEKDRAKAQILLQEIDDIEEQMETERKHYIVSVTGVRDRLDGHDTNVTNLDRKIGIVAGNLDDFKLEVQHALEDVTNTTDIHQQHLVDLEKTIEENDNSVSLKMEGLNNSIKELLEDLASTKKNLADTNKGIADQVKKDDARMKGIEKKIHEMEVNHNLFQMPILKEWKRGLKCSANLHGALRRISGNNPSKEVVQNSIVYCNGAEWTRISPIVGQSAENRIPGSNGCIMRDVYAFSTTSHSCRAIYMRTNIKIKSSVMFHLKFEGYNYGTGRHVDNSIMGYTYSGWTCSGSRSHRNYGDAGYVDQYCSGGFVIIRMVLYSSSYYVGFRMDASFLNPTGPQMCGLFKVVQTKCNSPF
eukprot:m.50037 g.50037  ORF g.50037 m.50037 type:complete len:417 (-) comp10643_c0_seq2:364-1614(-)